MPISLVLQQLKTEFGLLIQQEVWRNNQDNIQRVGERFRELLQQHIGWNTILRTINELENTVNARRRRIEAIIRRHDLANHQLPIENFLDQFRTLPEIRQYLTNLDRTRH